VVPTVLLQAQHPSLGSTTFVFIKKKEEEEEKTCLLTPHIKNRS
jgi:hypothetical protein